MVSITSEIQHLLVCVIPCEELELPWGSAWAQLPESRQSSDSITSDIVSSAGSWISWARNWWALWCHLLFQQNLWFRAQCHPKVSLEFEKKKKRCSGFFEYEDLKIFLKLIYPLSHLSSVLLSNWRVHWGLKWTVTVSEVLGNRRGVY